MSTLTIELADDTAAQLVSASKGQETTPEQLAAELITKALPTVSVKSGDEMQLERLMRWCGVAQSGIPDLATNPKHMEGFGADSL